MASATTDLDIDKMEEIFKKNGPLLLKTMLIEPMFVSNLVKRGAITSAESESLRAKQQPFEARQYLFDLIKTKLENFISFCIVLHDDLNRDDIVCEGFHLDIFELKRQKGEIEDRREKRRLVTLEKEKQAQNKENEVKENKIREEQKPAQQIKEPSTPDPPTTAYEPLTQAKVKQLLTDHRTALYDDFAPNGIVLALLKKNKVITPDTLDKLNAAGITPNEKKNAILVTVEQRGVKPFLNFCLVLCDENVMQENLVTKVLGLEISHIRKQRDEIMQKPH